MSYAKSVVLLFAVLGLVSTAHAENEVGLYFDSAGTISRMVLTPGETGAQVFDVYVVLHSPSDGVSGFDYSWQFDPREGQLHFMDSLFLDDEFCSFAHCDPDHISVLKRNCTCTVASPVVLQTVRLILFDTTPTVTLSLHPSNCLYDSMQYYPCGCHADECSVPMTLASDAEATVLWRGIPVETPSFGAVKALFDR